jgi:hypothetical protein
MAETLYGRSAADMGSNRIATGSALHHGGGARAAILVDTTRWPEYLELQAALHAYLNEATERIIRQEVFGDADEAAERAG